MMESMHSYFFKSTKYKKSDFNFIPPPEAPLFEPSLEEFQDPIAYINSIKPIAEKTGICKIKPPPEWEPPFALDIEKFKFTPRLQRLNELEAKTRIKLNFMDQIAKFWSLQGCFLKLPQVERKTLDVYLLHHLVKEEGGFDTVNREKKWLRIAEIMGYNIKASASLVKTHYERILYPYEVFRERELSKKMSASLGENGPVPKTSEVKVEVEESISKSDIIYNELKTATKSEPVIAVSGDVLNRPTNELKGLHCYEKNRVRRDFISFDPLAKYVCKNCRRGDVEESMLLCDGCDDSYHTFCLKPPLASVPKGDWRCPKCIANEVKKPVEAFGFEQAQREYTLHQFGEMADRFKSNYFSMPVHRVPTGVVEREFWRLVSSIDDDVCVEYGADLHSVEHGSGFPTRQTSNLDEDPSLKTYIESGWNLNNIPILADSVLSFINADISGMKVPWMYVGMCFSTFCWHNEDHWSYSINYLHWGEPKTWYGVPGSQADVFENCMKMAAPELFENQPDLLHQLVTILNPNILMEKGISVCRTDQQAGEFVITFPRAYHAGFNQGYNFAEAVNFAPVDWLKIGRECVNYYSRLHRNCVFSHDELVCKMAMDCENLHPKICSATCEDVSTMVEFEKKLRISVTDWGVTDSQHEMFELLPDDERQCYVCKTTLFLSAVTCGCSDSRLTCLRHYDLCNCLPSKHILKYRYSLDELSSMVQKLRLRAEFFDKWLNNAKKCVGLSHDIRIDLDGVKELITQVEEMNFPKSKLYDDLIEIKAEAEKCSSIAQNLLENFGHGLCLSSCQLTLNELTIFSNKLQSLPCEIPEARRILEWKEDAEKLKAKARDLIIYDSVDLNSLAECWLLGQSCGIDSSEFVRLVPNLEIASWIAWSREVVYGTKKYSMSEIQSILIEAEGMLMTDDSEELSKKLNDLVFTAKRWEERAKQAINKPRCNQKVEHLEELLCEGLSMNVLLPSISGLSSKLNFMKELVAQAEEILNSSRKYTVDDIKELMKKIQPLPIASQYLSNLQKRIVDIDSWIKEASDMFLKDPKTCLLQVLCPAVDERLNQKKNFKGVEVKNDNINELIYKLKSGCSSEELLLLNSAAQVDLIQNIKSIQLVNIRKKVNARHSTEFCMCKRRLKGLMYECSLCKDWFHDTCFPSIKSLLKKVDGYGFDFNFICEFCTKSKRPQQMNAIKLLLKLDRLNVFLPEGEALKLLFERAFFYQLKFKKALLNDEIKGAIKKLKQSTLTNNCPNVNTYSFQDELDTNIKWQIILNATTDKENHIPNPSKFFIEMDHNYSLGGNALDLARKHNRKSPLVTRDCAEDTLEFPIYLAKYCIVSLKELFNLGGTIEVGLKENQMIWRLLQASVPHKVFMDYGPILKSKSSSSSRSRAPHLSRKKPHDTDVCLTNKKTKPGPTFEKINRRHSSSRLRSSSVGGLLERRGYKNSSAEARLSKKRKINTDDVKINPGKSSSKVQRNDDEKHSRKKMKFESCAAPSCSKPTGKKIDWVQCDGKCNSWFHMRCVGLDKKSLKQDDDYYCPKCQPAVKE